MNPVEPHGHSPWHPTSRPSGATSQPNVGAFIHGHGPWPSAAGASQRSGILLFVLSLFMLFLFGPFSHSAEIYRWTDEKGTVHFTDDPSSIPERYSKQGQKVSVPEEKAKDLPTPLKPDDRSDRVKAYLKEIDKKIEAKKKIEGRISALEEESLAIQERLKVIEELEREDFQYYQPFRDRRTGNWVNVASPYYDEKRRLESRRDSITKELLPLQEELSKIKRSL